MSNTTEVSTRAATATAAAVLPPASTFGHHAVQFTCGALAACGAVTFTNPWEVVKTRLQLQGELEQRRSLAAGATPTNRPYPSAVSALVTIARNEGLRGIQRGLGPAYFYQVLLNGCRLGMYEPIKNGYQRAINFVSASNQTNQLPAMILGGATSGVLGASIASPLYLVKTRMQSYTTAKNAAVGAQHSYVQQGTISALRRIYSGEGIRGLWRGADAAMLRTGVGSAVQLSSYESFKNILARSGWFDLKDGHGGLALHLGASAITSFFVCLAMNPFDVASTRMYNQQTAADGKQGALYKNGIDCLVKSVKAEGFGALYKGFFAHYLRIGPHTILTFVFFEQLKKLGRWIDL
ncbi:mitochondrial carrier domain-containing protein [Fimicolochytrium jonesii]|uniref:mitochondrial carrier domain-containing protein n=1 Tax=Fimicolochytrium jonesii TaxID=1396493 RepID=UPI0022FE9A90|nr:mitochondrial carrier domain-containing protein [Fimicolochytrium jonesii]KAI8824967.1 mitochondrial carrier domain-containing protein [Fimicolochytrium jonesii]